MLLSNLLNVLDYDSDFIELMSDLEGRYPAALFNLDGIGDQLDISKFSKKFFSSKVAADASIDANANVEDTSNIAYTTEVVKPWHRINSYAMLFKKLKQLYTTEKAKQVIEDQLTGKLYINDFHGLAAGTPYCFNYSTYDIMLTGLPMVSKIKSKPPKYLYSFKSQLEQFIVIASNATLGATGLADLFIVMSYYVRNIFENMADGKFCFNSDNDIKAYIKETLVSFIYTINQPFRSGLQSPFVNVSVYDINFMEQLCDGYVFPDGRKPDVYWVETLQNWYLEVMNEEMQRTPVTFPVTTACFATGDNNEILDKDFLTNMVEANKEFGFINFYFGKTSTLSSCCRLRSDTDNEYFNSFGAGSTKIGSLGVCTINLPRLAEMAKDFAEDRDPKAIFLKHLKESVADCAMVNNAKRRLIERRIQGGNLPLYSHGIMDLNKQYSTCGINGLNEALKILGLDIMDREGQDFALDVLDTINEVNDEYQARYKAPHNCEQIPGENSSIKLAQKDTMLGYNKRNYPLYSNQFIPLTTQADLLDRITLQGMFDRHFTGGAICHLNVEEKVTDTKKIEELLQFSAQQGVVYCAINYNLQECEEGHMAVGNESTCTICGGNIVGNYTRVVGFLTNTKNWHRVRRDIDYPYRVWGTI